MQLPSCFFALLFFTLLAASSPEKIIGICDGILVHSFLCRIRLLQKIKLSTCSVWIGKSRPNRSREKTAGFANPVGSNWKDYFLGYALIPRYMRKFFDFP